MRGKLTGIYITCVIIYVMKSTVIFCSRGACFIAKFTYHLKTPPLKLLYCATIQLQLNLL